MFVGFTGTRKGMTAEQKEAFKNVITEIINADGVQQFHHGDCTGADAEAHEIINEFNKTLPQLKENQIQIHIHPAVLGNAKFRAFKLGHKMYAPKDPLKRNRDIVNAANILIATPKENNEVLRSGTWTTVRYAKKKGCSVLIIPPAS